MGAFKYIVAEKQDGSKLTFPGDGPLTESLEKAILLSVTPPPPARLPLTKLIAAENTPGDGVRIIEGSTGILTNTHVQGYDQNIVIKTSGPTSFVNVRSVEAWRRDPAQSFTGQGLYTDAPGRMLVQACLFGWNGWQQGRPIKQRNGHHHGIYQDDSFARTGRNFHTGQAVIEDSIIIGNPGAGIQLRGGGILRRCVLIDNSMNFVGVAPSQLENCVIFGATRYVEDGFGAWQGNCGVLAYDAVKLKDTWLVGRKGQNDPTVYPELPGLKSFNMGGLKTDRGHRDNPNGIGSIRGEGDCRCIGWPEKTDNRTSDVQGVAIVGGSGIVYDPMPIIANVLANKVSIEDACALIRAAIRKAAA